MLRNCIASIRQVYTALMNVLSAGYVLGVIASQSSNSLSGKMLNCINNLMALMMICVLVYGSCARTYISWQCSILQERDSGASAGLNGLQKCVSLVNSVIVSGFLYVPSSWSSISCMVMLAFQPIRVGTFETMNWSETFSSSMRKHALMIFFYEPYLFCACTKIASAVLICIGNANCAYTTTPPKSAGATNGLGLRSAYTIGNNTKLGHPLIVFWGQTSCLSTLTM
jgi:hypothetical protein